MATKTPRAGLNLPDNNDVDIWGNLLNENTLIIDSYLGELIDGRGGFDNLNERFTNIEDELSAGAGNTASIAARFDSIEESVFGSLGSGYVQGFESARSSPNTIYKTDPATGWWSYGGGTFYLQPSTLYVIDSLGKIRKLTISAQQSITVTSNPSYICIKLLNDVLIDPSFELVTLPVTTNIDKTGYRFHSQFTENMIAIGETSTDGTSFYPYVFRGVNVLTDLNLSYDLTVAQSVTLSADHDLGVLPKDISAEIVTVDGGGVVVSYNVSDIAKAKLVCSRRSFYIVLSNLSQTDLAFTSGSFTYTPVTLIGYRVYVKAW